jgi:hypothetical protein
VGYWYCGSEYVDYLTVVVPTLGICTESTATVWMVTTRVLGVVVSCYSKISRIAWRDARISTISIGLPSFNGSIGDRLAGSVEHLARHIQILALAFGRDRFAKGD